MLSRILAPSSASFYAKRLILVESLEKNGLNKEISRPLLNPAAGYEPLVNHMSAPATSPAKYARESRSRHNHRFAVGRKHYSHSAGLRQKPCVVRLHCMGIDRRGVARAQQIGDVLRHAGVEPAGGDTKADCIAFADRIDREHAAARNGL